MSLDVSVVIPVWNGEHSLGRLLPRVSSVLASVVGRRRKATPTSTPIGLPLG